METITVEELFCYPVKSCRGIAMPFVEIETMGIRYDHQWMIVDKSGTSVVQRKKNGHGIGVTSVCLIRTEIIVNATARNLALCAPDMETIALPLEGRAAGELLTVKIGDTSCQAVDQGEEASEWLTRFISRERPGSYRLVRMNGGDEGERLTLDNMAQIFFVDNYPLLVISRASLEDLNRRSIHGKIPMNRFRPNIVLDGCEPYAEDRIGSFRIGSIQFNGGPRCIRCSLTAIDQRTGTEDHEPLRTLATYRSGEGGVFFGRYFSYTGAGIIRVGDTARTV